MYPERFVGDGAYRNAKTPGWPLLAMQAPPACKGSKRIASSLMFRFWINCSPRIKPQRKPSSPLTSQASSPPMRLWTRPPTDIARP